MPEWFNLLNNNWHHYIPFAALIAREPIPENRPAMTRILEQSFVGIIAAAVGSYVMIQVHATEIESLKRQRVEDEQRSSRAVEASEARLTAQITELRSLLLRQQR